METITEHNVLLTGAGGFIGSSVVQVLLSHGAKVRALLGPPGVCATAFRAPGLENFSAEITDAHAIGDLMHGIDVVVHMAGPPSVMLSFERAADYANVHVVGTTTVLEACVKARVRRFVYISSAEVYGRPRTPFVTENHPLEPRSPYAAAKVGAEQFVRVFAATFNIPSVILRPFSVYGPGASPYGVVGTIFRMSQSEEIVLQSLGPVRDYCYVDDVADAVLRACSAPVHGILTVNVGSGTGTSVQEFAQTVLRARGRTIPIRADAGCSRPADAEIYRLVADRTLAETKLGWLPATSLEYGVRRCF